MIAFSWGSNIKLVPESKEEAELLRNLAEVPYFCTFALVKDGLAEGDSLLIDAGGKMGT